MTDIYEFNPQIYPLRIWVTKKPSIEALKKRFDVLDDDNVTTLPFEDDTIKPYWGAARITVIDKQNNHTGCLIVIMVPQKCSVGVVAHEASHAYDDFIGLLDLPATGECRAYLTEWIADRIWEVKTGKVNKLL